MTLVEYSTSPSPETPLCRVHCHQDLLCVQQILADKSVPSTRITLLLPDLYGLSWAEGMRHFFLEKSTQNRLFSTNPITERTTRFLYEFSLPPVHNHQILYESDFNISFPAEIVKEYPEIANLYRKKLGYRQGTLYVIPTDRKSQIFDFNLCFLRPLSVQLELCQNWIKGQTSFSPN